MARAVLRESVIRAAGRARVDPETLRRLELGRTVTDQIRNRVQAMYEELGMTFFETDLGEFGITVKPFTLSFVDSGSLSAPDAVIHMKPGQEA
jgi:hypothetical protein